MIFYGDSSVFQRAIDQANEATKHLEATERSLTRTENATEKYEREIKQLNNLLDKGAISQKTFTRAVEGPRRS
jgi:DNA-binding transcriptional regulator GbsR (MarR family)